MTPEEVCRLAELLPYCSILLKKAAPFIVVSPFHVLLMMVRLI